MIKEKMKDFLKVKQELKGEEAIREYNLQITNGEPYEFRLVKKKGIPPIKCRIAVSPDVRFSDSDLTWYVAHIGEATYHFNENSLSPEKIIMLINDYIRISKGLIINNELDFKDTENLNNEYTTPLSDDAKGIRKYYRDSINKNG